jgi:hypothetical protein
MQRLPQISALILAIAAFAQAVYAPAMSLKMALMAPPGPEMAACQHCADGGGLDSLACDAFCATPIPVMIPAISLASPATAMVLPLPMQTNSVPRPARPDPDPPRSQS